MSSLTDFIHAIRGLRKAPVLAAVAIASLALAIAANVTVFSVVREMILDDLSAHRPDRLARVEGVDVSYPLYRDLRSARAFEALAFHLGLRDRIWRDPKRQRGGPQDRKKELGRDLLAKICRYPNIDVIIRQDSRPAAT